MVNISQIGIKAVISRIRQLRRDYAGNRGKALFAKELRISPSTYNYYERDRMPPVEVLWGICELTGADIGWLLTGKSAGKIEGTGKPLPKALNDRIATLLDRDSSVVEALNAFVDLLEKKTQTERTLSDSQEVLPESPEALLESKEALPDSQEALVDSQEQRDLLPILGSTAAGMVHFWNRAGGKLPGVTELGQLIDKHQRILSEAGRAEQNQPRLNKIAIDSAMTHAPQPDNNQVSLIQLTEVGEDGICEFVACRQISQLYPDAFGLRVDGDSMAPRIGDGDIVIVSPSVAPRNGTAAVVQLRDQIGVTCKIIRRQNDKIHLIPANEKFDIKIYNEEKLDWALAVLWRICLH